MDLDNVTDLKGARNAIKVTSAVNSGMRIGGGVNILSREITSSRLSTDWAEASNSESHDMSPYSVLEMTTIPSSSMATAPAENIEETRNEVFSGT